MNRFLLLCLAWAGCAFASAKYPFPFAATYPFGTIITPPNSEAVIQRDYQAWLVSHVEACPDGTARVKSGTSTSGGQTVSTTISGDLAYGMLITVFLDYDILSNRNRFDQFWKFYQKNRNASGLMHWKIVGCSQGVASGGMVSSTSADVDVALALLMASKQWDVQQYKLNALQLLGSIWDSAVDHRNHLLKPWDGYTSNSIYQPSDFSLGALRVFQRVDPSHDWGEVADACQALLRRAQNPSTGLVPDWVNFQGQSIDYGGSRIDNFGYDAARTTWRVLMDYLWFGDATSKTILTKIDAWIKNTTGNDPSEIVVGYRTDGTATSSYPADPAYLGALLVPGMTTAALNQIETNGSWLGAGWSRLHAIQTANPYNHSWKLIYEITMAGMFQNLWGNMLAPQATTGSASSIGATDATISGVVNAHDQSATIWIEYGTTTAYGTKVAASPAAASGASATPIRTVLSGLTPNTVYHYRVTAASEAGSGIGMDRTFTTLSAQSIVFDALEPQVYGTEFVKLAATASSGLPVSYASSDSDVVRISNDTAYLLAAGTATITARQAGDAIHGSATPISLKMTVAKKPLGIVGAAALDKVYDGTTDATVTGARLDGVVSGDQVALVLGSARFETNDAGTRKPVTVSGSMLSGPDSGNYALTEVAGLAASISPKPILVQADALVKAFGSPDPAFTATITGLVGGEMDSVVHGLVFTRDTGSAPGRYAIVPGGASATNYVIGYANGTLTIEATTAIAPRRTGRVSRALESRVPRSFARPVLGRGLGDLSVAGRDRDCDDGSCQSVEISLPRAAEITVGIFDNLGTPVIRWNRTLTASDLTSLPPTADGRRLARLVWNLRAESGEPAPEGVYLWWILVRLPDGTRIEEVHKLGLVAPH